MHTHDPPPKRLARLEALHTALLELIATSPVEEQLLQRGIEILAGLCRARYGSLALTDHGPTVRRYLYTGLRPDEARAIGPPPQGRGLIGMVLREGSVLRLADMGTHPARAGFPPGHPPMRSLLALPLRAEGRVLGALFLCDRTDGRPFDEDDEWTATRFAEALAALLVRAQASAAHPRPMSEMHKLSTAIEQTADSILITDASGVIEYVNAAFERVTGFTRAETVGRKPNLVKSGHMSNDFYRRLWETILRGEVFRDIFINRRKDGTIYYEEKTITPLKDPLGQITHFVSTGKDISERMRFEERLHYLAHHDLLTGLPNRALLLDRLHQALARAHWNRRTLAVLFLDLDRFKNINDTLGHDLGDRLLQALAGRLSGCVRDGDTVSRLGGDEIAILLEDVAHTDDIANVARKILTAFDRPFSVNGHELFIAASIGISVYPHDGEDATTLLKHADIAMYRAKQQGGGQYTFFSAEMTAASAERLRLENDLRQGLARGEFLLYYQPLVALRTGAVVGVEALLRWQHPRLGLLAPAHFIELAEETGLIVPLGEWALREACRQAKAWLDSTSLPDALRVAENVSGRQFRQQQLADIVAQTLAKTALSPNRLAIELTESTLIQHLKHTEATLERLHEMGVAILLDDFGTGYSSLSYLKRFPITALKIDRSFVRDITHDPDDAAIVTAITTMAHHLGIEVIAEGVETREQLEFLRRCECDAMQGYYLSQPLPAETARNVLGIFGIPPRRT